MDRPYLLLAVLVVAVALAGCTGGADDADGDGLSDTDESAGWEISVETSDGIVRTNVTSDPEAADTDGDGLDDFREFRSGTDPQAVDSDGDGLADGPNATDIGGSVLTAYQEAGIVRGDGTWIGEQDFCSSGSIDPADWDSDSPQIGGSGDGLSDGEEVVGWTAKPRDTSVPVTSNPCLRDTDGDDLNDSAEKKRSTDPADPDTDGDGVEDRLDADPLWDLSLTFNLTSVRLKQDMDTGGGADMRFRVQVSDARETVWRNVTSTGQYDLGLTFDAVDVDDQSPGYLEKAVPAFVRAHDVDATDEEPLRITPAGNDANLEINLFDDTATRDGNQVGSDGSGSVSGPDAKVSFTYTTVRG